MRQEQSACVYLETGSAMKILMLSQGRKIEDQPDFDVALRNAECDGENVELLNIPYVGYVEKHGGEAFYSEVVRANSEFKPDLVFFQFFHSANPGDPCPCVSALRAAKKRPLVFGSIGDAFDTGLFKCFGRVMPLQTLKLAEVADAIFTTTMGSPTVELIKHGAKNVVFLPHAFLPEHFPLPDIEDKVKKQFDVVMIGSRPTIKALIKRPLLGFTRGFTREATVRALSRRFGDRFALFGNGWKGISARGACRFSEQLDMFRRGRIGVDFPAQVADRYYMSDRPFFILGSGTPLIIMYVAGLDKIFKDGKHAYFASSIVELPDVCEKVLRRGDDELEQNRRDTLKLIANRHLIANRMDTMLSVYEALKRCRSGECSSEAALRQIRMHHFLPEIDLEAEYKHAVANWRG